MQAVQPGTQQQQQQQQARQHSGPYGLLDEQNDSTMNHSAAPTLAQQPESQHQQQQARQHTGPHELPHDQGGSSTVMEDSAAPQRVKLMHPAHHQCRVKDWSLNNACGVQCLCKCRSVMCMLLPHKGILCGTMQAGELVQQLTGMQLQEPASSAGGPHTQQPACQLFRHGT